MRPAIFMLAAYLLGSVPFGYAAGRLARVDLRREGSGNTGATNVYRVLGSRWAIPVIVADVLKGLVPVWFFPLWDGRAWPHMALVYGVAAISGHVWSVFLRFKGGKGVATAAGAMLALAPVAVAVSILAWIGLALITRVVSIGSLIAAALVPVLAFYEDAPPETILFALGLTVLVWWTHRSNLGRLLRGEELPFRPNPTTDGSAGEMPGDPPGSRPADLGVGREEP